MCTRNFYRCALGIFFLLSKKSSVVRRACQPDKLEAWKACLASILTLFEVLRRISLVLGRCSAYHDYGPFTEYQACPFDITWTCPAGSAPQIISGDISLRRNILQGTKVCLWPVPFTVAAYFAVPFTVAAYWNRVRGTSNLWVWVWETLAHCKVWGQEKSPCIPQLHLRTNLNSNVQPLVHISKPCTYSAQVSSLG